ncbi:MAG: YWFCY domain-containing protein [Puia sp.]|nr:YWFCY domain-containing protein [Puia sp.]
MQLQHERDFREVRWLAASISIFILLTHYYYSCYQAFESWHFTSAGLYKLVRNLSHGGLFQKVFLCKVLSILFISMTHLGVAVGGRGVSRLRLLFYLVSGSCLYFMGSWLLYLEWDISRLAIIYIVVTTIGWLILYRSTAIIAGSISLVVAKDVFNKFNESFPQQEDLSKSPFSVNIRAKYRFRNSVRDSWLNIREVFKGSIILGLPGSGKTRYFFRPIINQLIEKEFCGMVFDFKFDDLSRLAYNALKKHEKNLTSPPAFYVINFEDLSRTHRCNPLDPEAMHDISDALESAKIILLAINRQWIQRQGEFFVESAISFITANIWFLRKYEDGKYCTLPHLIELIQSDYNRLFSVLRSFPEISTLINTFVSAFLSDTMDQLEGQVASARIALSSLASPNLYYVLGASDFTLDINNPADPKLVCMGSNPQKQMLYGAVLSLYISRMIKIINKKGQRPCFLVMDEYPTIYFPGMDTLLATGRQHMIAPFLGVQQIDQLRKEYGREHADVIFNLPANIMASMSNGDTDKLVSERIGRIIQPHKSFSINSRDSSTSQSEHLDYAIPASKISTFSSGEFVGIVADSPDEKVSLKAFHCEIQPDLEMEKDYQENSVDLPIIRTLGRYEIEDNFNQIKADIQKILTKQMERMAKSPVLSKLIINKSADRR